jgi:hypothetical protein
LRTIESILSKEDRDSLCFFLKKYSGEILAEKCVENSERLLVKKYNTEFPKVADTIGGKVGDSIASFFFGKKGS